MFEEIRWRISSLSAWMESCYSSQPLLHLGLDTIHSCCGVQQGDPLAPLGFALMLHPVVKCIKAEVPGLALNAWYLDGGTLMGFLEDLAAALHITERDGPSVGLYLNRAKFLFILEEADTSLSPLPPNIPMVVSPSWAVPLAPLLLLGGLQGEVYKGEVFPGGSAGHGRLSVGVHSPLLISCPPQGFFHTSHLPPTNHICLQPWSLTTLCKMPWKPSWVGPCRTGRGSRHLFPAAVGVSTFTVLRSILLLPSSPPGPDPCS